jgi:hypothetical protein
MSRSTVTAAGLATLLVAGPASAQDFTKITTGDPFSIENDSRSANWIDIDGDGDLDLFVSNSGPAGGQRNELYRNDAGALTAILGVPAVLDTLRDVGATWGDHDDDGDPDVYCTSWWGQRNGQWNNQGGGTFAEVTAGPQVTTPTHSEDACWVDADLDGDLDLFVANAGQGAASAEDNVLYVNQGGSVFAALPAGPWIEEGRLSRHGAWGDYDNDGDPDLFVANEAGQDNLLYRNLQVETGSLSFEEMTTAGSLTSDGGQSFSASWGDWDNDGDLDLVVGNFDAENNFLYRNELFETGSPTFTRILDQHPATNRGYTVSTTWADWDNDGDLDLLLTNGFATSPNRTRTNFLYRNDGGFLARMTGSPVSTDEGWTYGAAWGDWDEDGDLDLFTARCFVGAEANVLYRNEAQATGHHWLGVRCVGTVSNRSGIGARVRVKASIGGHPVWQMREVSGSDGYASQNLDQHFGLGDATVVDSVVVRWPSGTVQVLGGVAVDQRLEVTEPAGTTGVGLGPAVAPAPAFQLGVVPNPFRASTMLTVRLARSGPVDVRIHDAGGRLVREIRSTAPTDEHRIEWDGRDRDGHPTAPGVYFARARTGSDGTTATLVRLR